MARPKEGNCQRKCHELMNGGKEVFQGGVTGYDYQPDFPIGHAGSSQKFFDYFRSARDEWLVADDSGRLVHPQNVTGVTKFLRLHRQMQKMCRTCLYYKDLYIDGMLEERACKARNDFPKTYEIELDVNMDRIRRPSCPYCGRRETVQSNGMRKIHLADIRLLGRPVQLTWNKPQFYCAECRKSVPWKDEKFQAKIRSRLTTRLDDELTRVYVDCHKPKAMAEAYGISRSAVQMHTQKAARQMEMCCNVWKTAPQTFEFFSANHNRTVLFTGTDCRDFALGFSALDGQERLQFLWPAETWIQAQQEFDADPLFYLSWAGRMEKQQRRNLLRDMLVIFRPGSIRAGMALMEFALRCSKLSYWEQLRPDMQIVCREYREHSGEPEDTMWDALERVQENLQEHQAQNLLDEGWIVWDLLNRADFIGDERGLTQEKSWHVAPTISAEIRRQSGFWLEWGCSEDIRMFLLYYNRFVARRHFEIWNRLKTVPFYRDLTWYEADQAALKRWKAGKSTESDNMLLNSLPVYGVDANAVNILLQEGMESFPALYWEK